MFPEMPLKLYFIKYSKIKVSKLYEKYLERRTNDNETAYRLYKILFESIKPRSKQNYYSENLLRFKYNSKKTWATMKELIGKVKLKSSNLPRKITVNKVDLFDQTKIVHEFNFSLQI